MLYKNKLLRWRRTGASYRAEVDKLASKARLAIKIIGGALVLAFGWLQLKDFPLVPLLESTQASLLLKVALAFYYLSWVFGTNFDVGLQQDVYLRDQRHGNLGWLAIAAIVGFGAVAAVLLWVSNDEKRFAVVLVAFVVVNVLGWLVVVSRVSSIIQISLLSAGDDFFEIERLRAVQEYISGKWQRSRFLTMFGLAVIGTGICFFPGMRSLVSSAIVFWVSDLNEKKIVISQLLPAFLFVFFIVVAESWIWAMRAKAKLSLALIEHLKDKYELRPAVKRGNEP